MGFSGGSSTKTSSSTTKPVYEDQIMGAYNNVNDAFKSNQGTVDSVQSMLSGLLPQAQANYSNNGTLNAAKGYVQDTLGQDYSQNPYLQKMINQTGASVANKTASALGSRGNFGGSGMAKLVSGQLANSENNLRYTDYNNWANRQAQAAGMAPGIATADNANLQGLLGLGNSAANLKTDNALKQAAAVSSLLGGYTSSNGKETTEQSGSFGQFLGALLLSAAQNAGAIAGGG